MPNSLDHIDEPPRILLVVDSPDELRLQFFSTLVAPYIRWFLAGLLAVTALTATADQTPHTRTTQVDLTPATEFLEDVGGTLTIADIKNHAASRFKPMATPGDVNL